MPMEFRKEPDPALRIQRKDDYKWYWTQDIIFLGPNP